MKELKDIVLKKGDIITYTFDNSEKIYHLVINDYYINKKAINISEHGEKILKIERPTTIYEAPKQILDKEEKEYLEAVCKPFKEKVISITKHKNTVGEWIEVFLIYNEVIEFPVFKANTMYKGMELNKEYTLKELGLFE